MFRKALSRVGWALLGIIALGGFCVWLVYLQLLQLDGENRRELSRAAREIGTTLNELSATAARTLNVDNRLPSEEDLNGFAGELSQRNPYIVDREPRDFAVPGRTTLLQKDQCIDHRPGLASPRTIAVPARYVGAAQPAGADGENKTGYAGKSTGSTAEAWKVYKLEAILERIFEDVFVSRAFEQLFIAYPDGRVAFELTHGASAERRADRGWLVQRGEGETGRGRSTTRIENLKALQTAGGTALNLDVVAAASGSFRIYLGDRAYQLYAYPIRIATFEERPAETNRNCAEESIWIVAGIVDPQRMQEEAFTISPQWMLLVFLGFAVMVVGQPFVKLFFLKPTERFRSADAWLLLPSASVLLTLATLAILDIGTYGRLRSNAEARLETLATQVDNNIEGELRQMYAQLVDFDRVLTANKPEILQQVCLGKRRDVTGLLADNASEVWFPRPSYPSTIQVFWVDSIGKQILKATILQRGTGRQTVADREYFTEVSDKRLWSFDNDGSKQFFTQSLRSITTAELLTALSIPSMLSESCREAADFPNGTIENDGTIVAVVTGVHPTSVERPPLPAGYSFAIIAANGAVLYHSDRRRILKENLFEEFDDPERLQAAVHGGTPQRFHTTYARRPTEVFITPFNAVPAARWFIATLRDEQWLETANSEALLRTTFWSVVAAAPMFLVSLVLLFAGKRWLPYLWPDAKKESFYKLMAPLYASILLAGLVSSLALDGAWLFWASVGFPLFVIVISGLTHWMWARRGRAVVDSVASLAIFRWGRMNRLTHKDWYFLAVAALWACTAVVPATGMFRYSWTLELAKFRSLEWNRIEQQEKAWEAQDASEWKHVNINDRPAFLESRRQYLDAYVSRSPIMQVERLPFERWLDNHLPLYNDVAERLRDQSPAILEGSASSSQDDFLNAGLTMTWQTLIGGVLVAFAAWKWLRYKDRHLLWSHLPVASPTDNFPRLASMSPLLAIVTPSERARARLTKMFMTSRVAQERREPNALATTGIAPTGLTDDVLNQLEQIAGTTTYGMRSTPDDTATMLVDVKIDDFEQDMLRPDLRLTHLKDLEACVAGNGRAVILSRVDLLRFLSPESAAPGESGNLRVSLTPAERERWLAALELFAVHNAAVEDIDETGMHASENHELYFDSLWRHCSAPEKLTLVQVAEEGFANPHQESVVKGLVSKRLLKLGPNLQLMNAAFEKFVLQQGRSNQVATWERPEGALGWRGIRWILAFLVVAVLLFLATTQGAWFNSAAAILGGIAVGLEAVSGVLHAFNRARQPLA